MKRISWLGVIVGGVADIVLTNVFTLPILIYAVVVGGIISLPKAQQATATMTLIHTNIALFATATVLGAACSVLAGYIAAWLAKHDEILNGAFSSFLCVGSGLYGISKGVGGGPMWLAILLLPASPLLGAAGGYLRKTQRNRATLRLRSG